MTQKLRCVLQARAELGEGPRWHPDEQRLYWVDIACNELHRLDPVSGRDECRPFDDPVGCFAFVDGGGLMLAMKNGFALLREFHLKPEQFGDQILAGQPELRFNDGRTDPQGRFWVGSVNTAKSARNAALYRLEGDGSILQVEGGMLTCNGAAFSPDGRRFFHADTPSHAVRLYDFDGEGGTIANGRIFHQFPLGEGRPDGASVDAEGCYWTALFDGGRVVRLSPDGEVLTEIALPAPRPTMICFGGPDYRTAFVTTARTGLSKEALEMDPLSGSIFSFDVDVPGIAETTFRLGERP
ncbi:SMP-30/gluconolactonase/LRE family protein [Rhizorhapis suberifaciens]|uniref:Sugar lactone lactonase YvrE n=1 Tax=Rhizorhapis suberifaciens TaxID=13656 RepID=A0A840HW06_9SPHN|nr:SMP-30/gluconolactonase/LRE family protein [Rhizorhapis suberifaciens]MBB4641861.1 sugar lactone lactonase YvrE [Rhizorhapis suberifaciens]